MFNTIGNIDISPDSSNEISSEVSIKVYPNPSHSTITFEILGMGPEEEFNFELYNLIGKRVKITSNITDNTFLLGTEGLHRGIYIFKIKNKNGFIVKGKFVVN